MKNINVKVTFCKGLPGSGKSYWSLEYCMKHKDTIRVNRDSLRLMRGQYWLPEQEFLITIVERTMVKEAILAGYNVIIDSMNLSPKTNQAWSKFLTDLEVENPGLHISYETKVFDTDLKTCIARDAMRPEDRGRVGAKTIREIYYKYIADVKPVRYDPKLSRHAIIVDLDGTIALKGGRGTYEYHKVGEDHPNIPVIDLIQNYKEHDPFLRVLFMSGRDDSCYEETFSWICKYLNYDESYCRNNGLLKLFMRKTGDKRKDSIVKRELFEEHIRGKYNIDFVLDDRDQVVEMWRNELGLTCFQVAEGNF